jgi:tripartite-type tricarboxylate transporter receptor subunit TctC
MKPLPLLVLSAAVLAISQVQAADPWPTKPVHLIVPFAPGGVNDIVARHIAEPLAKALKQPVVVENRPGAGGIVGTEAVARSAPDGYTIGMVASFIASAVAMNPKLALDPVRDLAPITTIGYQNLLLVVNAAVPAKDVKELVALAKAKPGGIHYASTGIGTSQHYAGELLKLTTGAEFVHVPYKGGGPAISDVVGGQVEMMFSSAAIRPHLDSGRARALAVSFDKRSRLFPDLPTLQESGVREFSVSEWYGVVAPAKTPPEIVNRLHAELVRIFNDPEFVAKLAQPGVEVETSTPEAFAAYIKSELARFTDIARRANIKPE